jgi:predicted phage tail protein
MMRTIHLHGILALKFGKKHTFDIDKPIEAISALSVNFKGFREMLREGKWHIYRGEKKDDNISSRLALDLPLGKRCMDVHIVPYAVGAGGRGGILKAILGAVLIVTALAFTLPTAGGSLAGIGTALSQSTGFLGITYGNILSTGVSLFLTGIAQMLSPAPVVNTSEPADKSESYLFNGPVNTSAEGAVLPVVYGKMLAGSVVMSTGFKAVKFVKFGQRAQFETDINNTITDILGWPDRS